MAGEMKTAPLITKKSSPVDRMIKKKLLRLQLCYCSVYTTSQECKSSARLSLSAFFPPCRNNFAQMQNLPHSSESPKIPKNHVLQHVNANFSILSKTSFP